MAIDSPLNAGIDRSFGAVVHANLVSQQPNGAFSFLSDPVNVSAIQADNLVHRARIANGEVIGVSRVDKFGSGTVGTSLVPISGAATYKTPTTATSLEFVSDNASDGVGGSGARVVHITGLNANFLETTQNLTTNGLTPVALSVDLIRLYRWSVIETGTYADETTGSHAGNLTIRGAGSGPVWDTIENTPFPAGMSHIGAYSIPLGKTGYLVTKRITVDSIKTVNAYFFVRDSINDITSPHTGVMKLIDRHFGLTGTTDVMIKTVKGPFVGPADIGALAQTAVGTAEVSINFDILLLDT